MVPFWVVSYYNRDPKRDYNFDNHPHVERQNPAVITDRGTFLAGNVGVRFIIIGQGPTGSMHTLCMYDNQAVQKIG